MININNEILRLSIQGEKVIESEKFRGLNYVIKDGHITLMAENHGIFSFRFDCLEDLTKEIKDVLSVWGDIRTKKCRVER